MALGKQAKILTEAQEKAVLAYLSTGANPKRNTVMFLLSVDAGLRAKEIASITWEMLTDAQRNLTDEIRLIDKASKGRSGGVVFISKRLKAALVELSTTQTSLKGAVVVSNRGGAMTTQSVTNWFFTMYRKLGFEGCSSHSGRRTAITKWARKINSVGGSLRDVQSLARHNSLQMTQRYIEVSEDAMKRVVG